MPHGHYTIVKKIADGGMAEIFLATQHGAEGFERPVVLKRILTAFYADPQFRNMLVDEAHISMSLTHSNIAQVVDLGQADGRYFLVLEFVDGWDLARILSRAKAAGVAWPPALALHVAAEVCRGLAYAHARTTRDGKALGIVHRDISPQNVLVSEQGEVKVTDFGIAKAMGKREHTAAGVIKGKLDFMSPEQAAGAPLDARSDIFSVGTMLYVMTTDHYPFEAGSALETMLRVKKAEFPAPESVCADLSPEVARVINRAMRLGPSERFQTAEQMLADLELVLRTEFDSAGQSELKRWLADLAQKDGQPTLAQGPALASDPSMEHSQLIEGRVVALEDTSQVGRMVALEPTRMTDRAEAVREKTLLGVGEHQPELVFEERQTEARGPSAEAPPPRSVARSALTALVRLAVLALFTVGGGVLAIRYLAPDVGKRLLDRGRKALIGALLPDAGVPPDPLPATRRARQAGDEPKGIRKAAAPPAAEERPLEETRDKGKELAAALAAKPKAAEVILRITSVPSGATVHTKERTLGRTPLILQSEAGASYQLRFAKPGFQPTSRLVALTANKDQMVRVQLKKAVPKAGRR